MKPAAPAHSHTEWRGRDAVTNTVGRWSRLWEAVLDELLSYANTHTPKGEKETMEELADYETNQPLAKSGPYLIPRQTTCSKNYDISHTWKFEHWPGI